MTDLGLPSVVPITFFVALAAIVAGLVIAAERLPNLRWLHWGYLVALALVLHATPAIVYGTLRYSWSWKHVGIVDFVQRTGQVEPDIAFLDIYHSWPGLFAFTAAISDLSGIDAVTLATWAPFAFTMLNLVALSVLFRAFTDDLRVVTLAQLVFVFGNWVGQEYFSPQAFGFFLYLGVLALALPLGRVSSPRAGNGALGGGLGPTPEAGHRRVVVLGVLVLAVLAIGGSHQLTPIMVVTSLAVAAALRLSRTGWLALTAAALTAAWVVGPAWSYTSRNLPGALETLGDPSETTSSSVTDTSVISSEQVWVVLAGRAVVLVVVLLAAVGFWRRWRLGRREIAIAAMALAPAVLLGTDYDGEILFRSYLFAMPWLALLGAFALVGSGSEHRRPALRVAATAIVVTLLAVGSVLAYLGKERFNFFTQAEVDAATWVYETAPPGTLLIEGSRNYPGQFRNYENLVYVPLDRESAATQLRLRADPVGELGRWMDNDRPASYLIITRSQVAEAEALAATVPDLLPGIEDALRRSDRFVVSHETADAVIFELADRP